MNSQPFIESSAAAVAPLVVFLLACSRPPDEDPQPEQPQSELRDTAPRPDLLWPVDLSDHTVSGMTLEELWQVGVDALKWPAKIPAGTVKADVHERLIEAKWHGVGIPMDYPGPGRIR